VGGVKVPSGGPGTMHAGACFRIVAGGAAALHPPARPMNSTPPACLGFLLLAACGADVRVDRGPDERVWRESEWRDGHLHGAYVLRHENGAVECEGRWMNGLKDGVWTYSFEDGQPARREEYARGVRTGTWTVWWPDGAPRSEGAWVAGDRDGEWSFWSESGAPYARELWDAGTRRSIERF